jgi:hypothetical protein
MNELRIKEMKGRVYMDVTVLDGLKTCSQKTLDHGLKKKKKIDYSMDA